MLTKFKLIGTIENKGFKGSNIVLVRQRTSVEPLEIRSIGHLRNNLSQNNHKFDNNF